MLINVKLLSGKVKPLIDLISVGEESGDIKNGSIDI